MSPRLPLPPMLLQMIHDKTWIHPGDDELLRLIPYLREPLDFRTTEISITSNQDCLLSPDEIENSMFHEYRGSACAMRPLPWRDTEKSYLIAINRVLGDDFAIALDYRDSDTTPSVIATEYEKGGSLLWREVAPTFDDFARLLYPTE